jgi:hypothetical protein
MSLIIKRLTYLKTLVQLSNSLNLNNVNIHAENFFRDLFNLLDNKQTNKNNFINTNFSQQNAAFIDLIDQDNKIAIQVTSQNDNTKISESIEGFLSQDKYKDYTLIILLISKEAKDYRTDFTFAGKYKFDHSRNIIDMSRLLRRIDNEQLDKIKEIAIFLDTQILEERSNTESNEIETIMELISFLSKDKNRKPIQRETEVNPGKKIYERFQQHSKYLTETYSLIITTYTEPLALARATMDSMQSPTITSYLQEESDKMLERFNNNPKLALRELVDYFESKLSTNGIKPYDKQAILFYLLDEMFRCNVFPLNDENL